MCIIQLLIYLCIYRDALALLKLKRSKQLSKVSHTNTTTSASANGVTPPSVQRALEYHNKNLLIQKGFSPWLQYVQRAR